MLLLFYPTIIIETVGHCGRGYEADTTFHRKYSSLTLTLTYYILPACDRRPRGMDCVHNSEYALLHEYGMRVLCAVSVVIVRVYSSKCGFIAVWLFPTYLYNVTCMCCFLHLLAIDDTD